MKTLILLAMISVAVSTASSSAYALTSDDRFLCRDGVSFETYAIEVIDIGDEEASINVLDKNGKKIRAHGNVEIADSSEGTNFIIWENGKDEAVIQIPLATQLNGRGPATFEDGGDSREIDCVKTR